MFGVKPKPFRDETLTSYFQRLGEENYINVMGIWRSFQINNRYPQSSESRFLDIYPQKKLKYEQFCLETGMEKRIFDQMTLSDLIHYFKGYGIEANSFTFLDRELVRYRKFCPLCIKEEGYYRRLWLVDEVKVCFKHNIYLNEECQECKSRIPFLFPWAQVGYCQCGNDLTTSKVTKVGSEWNQNIAKRTKEDWITLLDLTPKKFKIDKIITREDIAFKLLYVLNSCKTTFKGVETLVTDLGPNRVKMLINAIKGRDTRDGILHIRNILTVIRERDVTSSEFFGLIVPKKFQGSVLGKGTAIEGTECIAPWCKSFKSSKSIEVIRQVNINTKNGRRFKDNFFCRDCGIQYSLNEIGRVEERGNFISLGWYKIRPLILQGKNRTSIAHELGIKIGVVNRCASYLGANNLISNEQVIECLNIYDDRGKTDEVIEFFKRNAKINKMASSLNLTKVECFYYRYKLEVRDIAYRKMPQKGGKSSLQLKVDLVRTTLENMLENGEPILVESVAKRFNRHEETLRRWGVLSLIADYKKKQLNMQKNYRRKELSNQAIGILEQSINEGLNLDSEGLYSLLGVKRTTLVKGYPDLTKKIAELLKNYRHLKRQKRAKELLIMAEEAVENLKSVDTRITKQEVASAIGMSLSGISRYPEILKLVRESKG